MILSIKIALNFEFAGLYFALQSKFNQLRGNIHMINISCDVNILIV